MSNRIKKIVCFIESQFNSFDFERHGIDTLRANGFEVEVWDFTSFLHPIAFKNIEKPNERLYEKYNCQMFENRKQALESISKLGRECFIVCLLIFRFDVLHIYRAIKKYNLEYCVTSSNAIPLKANTSNKSGINKFLSFINRVSKISLINLVKYSFNRLPIKYMSLKPARFIMAGGEKSILYYKYPQDQSTEILWMHTLDYDLYLKGSDKNNCINNENYIVYLDEYVPYHRDFIYLGLKPYATAEEYYPVVRKFFDEVEKALNMKVIIAAHPRSEYEKHPDCFGGRRVIKNKTINLIKYSEFVLIHSSTSINFAVLYKKPMIFITTNQLIDSLQGPIIENFSSLFKKEAINLNETLNINYEKELIIDEEAYAQYKNDYIKKEGSLDLPYWQILAEKIKEI